MISQNAKNLFIEIVKFMNSEGDGAVEINDIKGFENFDSLEELDSLDLIVISDQWAEVGILGDRLAFEKFGFDLYGMYEEGGVEIDDEDFDKIQYDKIKEEF